MVGSKLLINRYVFGNRLLLFWLLARGFIKADSFKHKLKNTEESPIEHMWKVFGLYRVNG